MATTPTASPELPDLDRIANDLESEAIPYEGDFADAVRAAIEDIREVAAARRAQPEGEAPQAACTVPPEGWYCTRAPGHDGPCAALPVKGHRPGADWFARKVLSMEENTAPIGPAAQHAESGAPEAIPRWVDSLPAERAYADPRTKREEAMCAEIEAWRNLAAQSQGAPAPRIIGGQRWSKEAEMTEGWLAAQQAAAPGANALPHKIHELLRIYDETNGDWCAIARAVESRYVDATSAPGTPEASSDEDLLETVARAIWNVRREEEDRCDMELEDMGDDHPVWDEAEAVIAAIQRAAQLDGGQGEG